MTDPGMLPGASEYAACEGDVKKRTFPLTELAVLVKSVTSYPLAGLKR